MTIEQGKEYCFLVPENGEVCPEFDNDSEPLAHACSLERGHDSDEHVCGCGFTWKAAEL